MVVGKLVETAARTLKQTLVDAGLLGAGSTGDAFTHACRIYIGTHGALRARDEPPPGLQWDDEAYRGDAYGAYAWAVYVAAVSVDTATWETRIDDFVALQEIGRVLHPVLAAGQIEGGVAQAIGYALFEEVIWRNGRITGDDELHHATSMDLPPIRSSSKNVRTGRLAPGHPESCRWTWHRPYECDRPPRGRGLKIHTPIADGHVAGSSGRPCLTPHLARSDLWSTGRA
jgi:xanthine dehydrogenase molybdopterin-binding subunit B